MTWWDQPLTEKGIIFLLAKSSLEVADLSGMEDANIRLMSLLTGCFILAIGASIGSFLNVVVYRWPSQISLSDPPSECPQCRTPILRRDNIPVIAWLLLRGRCRACHTPISIRYPAVELAGGLVFVGLLFVELLSGGTNLPVFSPYSYAGVVWILWYTKWDLVGLYLFHLLLLMALGALALMHRDGFVPTWRPWRTSFAVHLMSLALVTLAFLPHLLPVPFVSTVPAWLERCQWVISVQESFLSNRSWNLGVSLKGLTSGALGFGTGLLCGSILEVLASPFSRKERIRSGLPVTLSVCGLFLGWQAATCIAVGAVVFSVIAWIVKQTSSTAPITSSEIVWLVTLGLLLNWRTTHDTWEQICFPLANAMEVGNASLARGSW